MPVKNVVMIVSDTLRRDHLGCYGNAWIRTPHLDCFAEKCVVFDNAYVGNFPTVPARLEYFTGRYSSAYFDWAPFPRDEVALAEVLTAAGLNTMCISDTMNLFRDGWCLIHTGAVGRKAGHEIFAVDGMPRQETMPAKITGPELYHLPSDPSQQHNVIERNERLAEELRAAYIAWFRRLGVPEEAMRPREKLWMD